MRAFTLVRSAAILGFLAGASVPVAWAQQSESQSGAAAPASGPATSAGSGAITSGGASAASQPGTSATRSAPVARHRRHLMLVNLNTATQAQLVALRGIDQTKADAIIAARPFSAPDELVSKNIVTQAEFRRIKGRITASP